MWVDRLVEMLVELMVECLVSKLEKLLDLLKVVKKESLMADWWELKSGILLGERQVEEWVDVMECQTVGYLDSYLVDLWVLM